MTLGVQWCTYEVRGDSKEEIIESINRHLIDVHNDTSEMLSTPEGMAMVDAMIRQV